jgi:hypothetical protein
MMRIKEAIQRRKLIQQLNDDWHNTQIDADQQQQQQQKTDQCKRRP